MVSSDPALYALSSVRAGNVQEVGVLSDYKATLEKIQLNLSVERIEIKHTAKTLQSSTELAVLVTKAIDLSLPLQCQVSFKLYTVVVTATQRPSWQRPS